MNILRPAWFITLKDKWLDKRIPVANQYRFDLNNTFILPTKFGWIFLLVGVFLFILGTNYQNNLVLLLCYFIFSVMLLSLFHSFYFFTRITIQFLENEQQFADQTSVLNIKVMCESAVPDARLYYQHRYSTHSTNKDRRGKNQDSIVRTLNLNEAHTKHQLVIGQLNRGAHTLPRMTFFASYPFGLFKTWSHLAIANQLSIYPAPVEYHAHAKNLVDGDEAGMRPTMLASSSEELQGIREYKEEDPIYHVSWKHVAKGQGMLSKDFAVAKAQTTWLDFDKINANDNELKLSQLCFAVLALSQRGEEFGLNLGSHQIIPNSGKQHTKQCLDLLCHYPNGINNER